MKKIEAIIRPNKVGEVCTALNKIGYPGVMVSEIEGHGKQHGVEQEFRGKTYKVELMTKASLQMVVNDEDVEKIVDVILGSAHTGEVGDGKIFIYPVADVVRIRTGQRGSEAV